jgi:hypothetical protein
MLKFFQAIKLQVVEPTGIKFPDFKNSGVSLRSQRIKLPSSLGQKKLKGIEQTLSDMKLGNIYLRIIYFQNLYYFFINIYKQWNNFLF